MKEEKITHCNIEMKQLALPQCNTKMFASSLSLAI